MTFGDVTNSEHCDIDAVRLADVSYTFKTCLFFEARCEGAERGILNPSRDAHIAKPKQAPAIIVVVAAISWYNL